LAPIRETGAPDEDAGDAIYRYVQQCEREKQQHEDVRLLYVAATRAVRRLHLLARVDVRAGEAGEDAALVAPRAMSLLAALWPAAAPALDALWLAASSRSPRVEGAGALASATIIAGEVQPPQPQRLKAPLALPAMPPPVVAAEGAIAGPAQENEVDFDWASETARHVGSVVHALLQRIAQDGLAHWQPPRIAAENLWIRRELRRLGVVADALAGAAERVVAALATTLADPRGRWLMAPHSAARSEWRLTGVSRRGLTDIAIDRTFIDESGTRWIVDFKTGTHEGTDVDRFLDNERQRYRAQLENYAEILSALDLEANLAGGGSAPIRLGLYFPLLAGWREWIWAGSA
jgi:ATP-dependent helicase/nuclease subunit A